MASEPLGVLERIRALIADHYKQSETPLLLSHLGKILRDEGLWPPAGASQGSLTKLMEEASDPDILVLRDPKSPAYIVVTDAAHKQKVEEFILVRSNAPSGTVDLARVPRAILFAFCAPQQPGTAVFIAKFPPHHYILSAPSPEKANEYWRIEDKYRLPGLKIHSVEKLPERYRRMLEQRVEHWMHDLGIAATDLQINEIRARNALQRLLEVQMPGVADKMLIPGDIALLLSKHE